MCKLQEIAEDYCRVKNYVYQRYSGIRSLPKLYPGYTVQNEMTESGLRAKLGLPSVYFYLAVFEALGDIKAQWTIVKNDAGKTIRNHALLTPEEVHYLNFVLRVDRYFASVLLEKKVELSEKNKQAEEIKTQYQRLSEAVDTEKLNAYLRRIVRKRIKKPYAESSTYFMVTERAYRYGDHGIYLSTKESRKRVFVELTDNNQYTRQLKILLHPEQGNLEILVPIDIRVKRHGDYQAEVGVALGVNTMLTTDSGNVYGEQYGEYHREIAEYVRAHARSYSKNKKDNPGVEKYTARKRRLDERLDSYINREINRFLRQEKPAVIYLPKLPAKQAGGINKKINHSMTMWKRGYIKNRIMQKCRENSIEVIEVYGKEIGKECSNCGAIMGNRGQGIGKKTEFFVCEKCNLRIEERINAARNAKKEWRRQQS